MKKITLALLTMPCLGALTACGSKSSEPSVVVVQATPAPQSEDVAKLKENNDKLLAQKKALENEKAALEKQLAEAKTNGGGDNLKKTQEKLTAAEKQLKDTDIKLKNANQDVNHKTAEIEKTAQDLLSLQNTLGEVERKAKELQKANEKLTEDLEKAKKGNQNGSTTQASEELTKAQEQLKKLQEQLKETQAQLEQAKAAANNGSGSAGLSNTAGTTNPPNINMPTTITRLDTALDNIKAEFNPQRTFYTGMVVSIDNNNQTAIGKAIPNDDKTDAEKAFSNFKINDTKIILLNNDSDVPTVRKLTANDFPDGGINHNNLGYVGSKYGTSSWNTFAQFRYGVYNDQNNHSHLFIVGNPSDTRTVESTRNLTYKGSAIIGRDGDYRPLEKAVTAVLDEQKTKVDISIQAEKELLQFSGKIAKNAGVGVSFSGDGVSGRTEGGFFGYDNIGGIFEVLNGAHKGENGVYGASNDKDVVSTH